MKTQSIDTNLVNVPQLTFAILPGFKMEFVIKTKVGLSTLGMKFRVKMFEA